MALMLLILTFACNSALAGLTVDPFALAVEPTWTATFTCNYDLTPNNTLKWIFNQTELATQHRRISISNGMLTISNATYTDAGQYTCTYGNESSDATLIVYDMPDYIDESMIIGFICLGLFVLLVAGVVLSYVKQEGERTRRLKARREKAEKRNNANPKYSN